MVIMKYWKNEATFRNSIFIGIAVGISIVCIWIFLINVALVSIQTSADLIDNIPSEEEYNNDINPDLRKRVPFGYIEGNGGSMEPTLCSGSEVWYVDKEIQKGDIVVFDSGKNGIVIHRTVRKAEKGWLTKGDNNNYIDQKVDLRNNYANESTTIGIVTSYKSNCNN